MSYDIPAWQELKLCAKIDYSEFLLLLGGKAKFQETMLSYSYGYSSYISNFRKLLSYLNINERKIKLVLKEIIITSWKDLPIRITTALALFSGKNEDLLRKALLKLNLASNEFEKLLKEL